MRLKKRLKDNIPLTDLQSKVKDILDSKFNREDWICVDYLKFDRYIDIASYDFLYVLGWYLAEGNANKCSVEITQKKDLYMKYFDEMIQCAKRLFPSVSVYIKEDGTKRLFIKGSLATDLFKTFGGFHCDKKRLHHDLLNLDLRPLLKGLLMGDAHESHSKDAFGIQLSMTSFNLISQVRQYFIDNGILPSLYRVPIRAGMKKEQLRIDLGGNVDEIKKINELTGLAIKNPERISRKKYIDIGDYLLVPISRIEEIGVLDNLYDLEVEGSHSFSGNGFILHNTQVEMLHKYGWDRMREVGAGHPDSRLRDIVKSYAFGGSIEIHDLITKQPIKKSAKPFLVENTVRKFEHGVFKYSKHDDSLTKQLLGYVVDHVTTSGVPVYRAMDETVGDHDLDSIMLALVAFTLETTDFGKPKFSIDFSFSGKIGEVTETPIEELAGWTVFKSDKKVDPRGKNRPDLERASLFEDGNKPLLGEDKSLPGSNLGKGRDAPKLFTWPGWETDEPKPQLGNSGVRKSGLGVSLRVNKPKRKTW